MPYTPYVWHDGSSGGTPLTADRLNALENAISTAVDAAESAEEAAEHAGNPDAAIPPGGEEGDILFKQNSGDYQIDWAPFAHTHPVGQVVALQSTLDGKSAVGHTHTLADLPVATSGTSNTTQLVRADDSRLSNARTPTTHTHAVADTTGLQTALDGKAASNHTHPQSEVTGLEARLTTIEGATSAGDFNAIKTFLFGGAGRTASPFMQVNLGSNIDPLPSANYLIPANKWATPTVDTDGGWSSANGIYTIPVTGYYWVEFGANLIASTAGEFDVYVLLNGTATTNILIKTGTYAIADGGAHPRTGKTVKLTAGNTLRCMVNGSPGGSKLWVNLYGGANVTEFQVRWVRP